MVSFLRFCLLITLSSTLYALPISASSPTDAGADSVRVIHEVTVQSKIRYHETIQPQVLNADALQQVNAHTLADALRYMSGVQLKDYGGIGGLKTVNLRSMGSQHVGIYYDGIELGNAQNGVIDLGQLSLDNIEEVSLYQGQRSAILQTASDFANAGSIYLRTRNPLVYNRQDRRIKSKLQFGSSNLFRLSTLYEQPLTPQLSMSANIEALSSDGHYHFNYRRRNYDGSLAYDTTAIRQNGDIFAIRAEANLYGLISNGHFEAKAYTYHSRRGIPGAIVNNVWRRGERQNDDNTLVQANWQKELTNRYILRILAKYAHYKTHYLNQDSTQMLIDNTYRQQEAYWSLTQVVELFPCWSLSLSYDGRLNLLDADVAQFASPTRLTHQAALASAIDLAPLQLQASIVFTHATDRVRQGYSSGKSRNWTPSLFLSWQLSHFLTLSAFAKQSFRLPTFNDLYYTNIGNALLKPERATQFDLGIDTQPISTTDAHFYYGYHLHLYHNDVTDKIVAYPKGQQFRWTMLNLGHVQIDGIDLQGELSWQFASALEASARVQYTYQLARDVTDRTTSYYRHQIPYTPWHSGSATLLLKWRDWDMAYNFVYTGERYSQPENIEYNHLQPWYTSDLHLAWQYCHHATRFKTTLEVNNLFDQQYDVIINYPMPGRNYSLTLQCEF